MGRTRKVWGRTRYKVGANSIEGESGGYPADIFMSVSVLVPYVAAKTSRNSNYCAKVLSSIDIKSAHI